MHSDFRLHFFQIGPGLVILNFQTSFGPMKLVQVVTPVEPLIQKVVHRIYCPAYLSMYASIVLFMEAVMVRYDFTGKLYTIDNLMSVLKT